MAKPITYPHTVQNRCGKVTIYRSTNGKYTQFRLVWRLGKHRQRESASDEVTALRRAGEILADITDGVASRRDGTGEEWAYFQKCQELLGDTPMMDAVRFFLHHKTSAVVRDCQLNVVCRQFQDAKAVSGCSKRYLSNLKYSLGNLCRVVKKPISMVRVQDLDNWLRTFDNPRTRKNHRGNVVALFSWAKAKGLLPPMEITAADRTDCPQVIHSEPGVLSPDQLRALLEGARTHQPDILAFLAIGAFAGVRAAEIMRLTWDLVDLEHGHIELPSAITKTRRRRLVEIQPALDAWLRLCRRHGAVTPPKPHNKLLALRDKIGMAEWPHNALRHSAVSYLMASRKDAAAVAEMCGHSTSMLQSNYKAIVTPAAAAEWFALLPKPEPTK